MATVSLGRAARTLALRSISVSLVRPRVSEKPRLHGAIHDDMSWATPLFSSFFGGANGK